MSLVLISFLLSVIGALLQVQSDFSSLTALVFGMFGLVMAVVLMRMFMGMGKKLSR